jgi:hypothetical protein
MRRLVWAALLATTGCIVVDPPGHRHRVVRRHPHGRVVVVHDRHVCDHRCDHYWHDDRWHQIDRHAHGPGCGHHFWRGRWYYVDEVEIEGDHRHDDDCGHYWHGGRWYHVHGHRHGPDCGHVHVEGRWTLIVR